MTSLYLKTMLAAMLWLMVRCATSVEAAGVADNRLDTPCNCTACVNDSSCSSLDDCLCRLGSNAVLCFNDSSALYKVTITQFFMIANLTNVTIQGPASITCAKGVGLSFYNIKNLTLRNITIEMCGLRLTDDNVKTINKRHTSPYNFQPNITVGVLLMQCSNVTLQAVTIRETQGIGLVCVNSFGQLNFNNTTFHANRPADVEDCKRCLFPYDSAAKCTFNAESVSGSVLLLYTDFDDFDDHKDNTSVNIIGSYFNDSYSCSTMSLAEVQPFYLTDKINRSISTTAGIEIILCQSEYPVDVLIDSSLFMNNTGYVGSGLNVEIFESASVCTVNIQNCVFSNNGQLNFSLSSPLPSYGGAISFIPYIFSSDDSSRVSHLLNISNCMFQSNSATIGGALFIPGTHALFDRFASLNVTIVKCNFTGNIGVLGHGIYMYGTSFGTAYFREIISVSIMQCNFSNNVVNDLYKSLATPQSFGVIYFTQITALLCDSVFINNTGTAVNLALSTMLMEGHVTFQDNNAISGGALYLQLYSALIFRNNSRVKFVNNAASTVGGAIFYEYKFNPAGDSFTNCFAYFDKFNPYCILTDTCYSNDMNIVVNFTDNKAGYGPAGYGSAIYGSGLYCPWLLAHIATNFSVINVSDVLSKHFSDVLIFSPNVTSRYVIATASRDLHADTAFIEMMPGQIKTVSLNATDHYGRPAIDTVAASMVSRQFKVIRNSSADILNSGYQLLDGDSMTATKIRINGSVNRNTSVVIYSLYAGAQLSIPVHTHDCLFGFVYNTTQHACLCDPGLLREGVTCDYYTGYLNKPRKKWIGSLEGDTVVYTCLFDFCSDIVSVDPDNLDEQCSSHRGGLLCGGCRPGYNAKLGHTGCGHCNGVLNLLIMIFSILLTGAWLVFVTAFLHIYVSDGHSYGIFFYVNMVFLFRNEIHSGFHHDLHGNDYFYAILNLRGIYNFCVHKNMDTLILAALDFVFPLYLFLIMIVITMISRCRGPYKERRFNYSTTKVFATLLYICYSLLVDYSFLMLTFTILDAPSGKEARWRLDPSVRYFAGLHGLLGTLSIVCLLILLAVALVLLFPRQAYRFRMVQKLKPLIDAFQAPFKMKYSFWIGLRLVIRICLHIIANTVPNEYQLYVVGCIFCLLLYAQSVCSPYTSNWVNALDNLFIILLIMQFIEGLSHAQIPVLIVICQNLFFLFYLSFVIHRVIYRFPKIYNLIMTVRNRLWSLVGKSSHRGYTEIESFAEVSDDSPTEPFESSVRTDYATVPTSTIPDIPEAINYSIFQEPVLEMMDDRK